MANLITEIQKNKIKSDYYFRLATLILAMASLLGSFFLAYVVPYYMSIDKKDIIIGEQFEKVISIENKENVGESSTRTVNETINQIKAVELYNGDKVSPSLYFLKIIEIKNSSIQINRLAFSPNKNNEGIFTVGGISKNRDDLVNFIENLKSQGGFSSVESPISDFAKDSNVPFTLILKTKI